MLQIYKASAGSGKTYKLAFEYIRALLGVKKPGDKKYRLYQYQREGSTYNTGNRHRYILAITFTNKATEEMKRRIIDELDALSSMPAPGTKDANYAEDLCKEFGCSRQALAEAAEHALRELLNDYGSMLVTTIDSFFQRVLRTFARELDRQGDFSVELNDKLAVYSAVSAMIDDFNAEPNAHKLLGKWIYTTMCEKIDSSKKSNFFNRNGQIFMGLVDMVTRICEEKFKPYAADMQKVLADPNNIPKLKESIKAARQRILTDIKDRSLKVWGILADHNAGFDKVNGKLSLPEHFQNYLMQGIEIPDVSKNVLGKTYRKLITGESALYPKKSKVSAADAATVIDLIRWVRTQYANYGTLGVIYKTLDGLILLGHAWQYLADFVAQNNIVLLSDTNHLLSRIIGQDDAPFIYERMGVQIRHFLIDEFQDTSRMQWSNLKPLVANGLSGGYDSLIIGDEKQSIYRFRNSDSSLLHREVAEIDFPGPQTHIGGKEKGENTNYRSAAEVVRLNNSLFSILADRLGVEGYENVVQEIPKHHLGLKGYVEFVPFVGPKKSKKDTDELSDAEKKEKDKIEYNQLETMTANMLRQHREGGYAWSDIAVLVDTNDQGAQVVEHLIVHHPEIPVLSDEALYVRKSPAVQLIVGILELLAEENTMGASGSAKKRYPDKGEVMMAINRFNYYHDHGMAPDKAINLALHPEQASAESLPEHLVNAIAVVKSRHASSLPALVETIIREIIPEDQRASQIAFLTAFQDYVLDYTTHYNPSLKSLLEHWHLAKKTLSVSSAADIDAVKVMTVHKSKGLEFGCVHIPFASWEKLGKASGQWVKFPVVDGIARELCPPAVFLKFEPKAYFSIEGSYYYNDYLADVAARYADTMNKTYVAYTRAERELYVYYDPEIGIGQEIADVLSDPRFSTDSDYRLCCLADGFDASTKAWKYGEHTVKDKKVAKAEKAQITPMTDYPVYYHSDTDVLTRVDDVLEQDSDVTTEADAAQEATRYEIDESARTRGVMLHEILSKIGTLADTDRAVERTRISMRLTKEETADITAAVKEMLNPTDARIRRWFADNAGVLTEQSIYLPKDYAEQHGGDDDNKRPDRIVFNHDGSVDVVDYKFTSETRSSHRRQVQKYAELLHSMGYDRVNGFLWYPFLQKIISTDE